MSFKQVTSLIAISAPLVPFITGIIRFRKLSRPTYFIAIMVAFVAAISLYSTWQSRHGTNNLPSLHLLIFIEVLFSGLYYYFLLTSKKLKKAILIIGGIFLVYTTLNTFYIRSIYDVVSVARGIQCAVMVCFGFFYLYEILYEKEVFNLRQSSSFIISISFIFYFGCTQFFWLLKYHVYMYDPLFALLFRIIHYFVNMVYYPLLAVGIWKKNY